MNTRNSSKYDFKWEFSQFPRPFKANEQKFIKMIFEQFQMGENEFEWTQDKYKGRHIRKLTLIRRPMIRYIDEVEVHIQESIITVCVFLRPVLIFYGIIGLILLLLGILAGFPFFIVPLLLILVVVGSIYFTLRWTKLIIRNNLANRR